MIQTTEKQKVALVLSGGGARGIAHIGVIEELVKRDIEISSIAGTSMGALVGGAFATGRMHELKEWFYTLDRRKVFSLMDFTLSRQGLIKADKVLKKMQDFVPDMPVEELPVPYAAVAVDMVNKEEVVFREGSLYAAIRASIAIPGVITPVRKGERLLVDGGVLNNIPMSQVRRTPGDTMLAVFVNAGIPREQIESTPAADRRERAFRKQVHEFQEHLKKITPQVKLPAVRKKHEHHPLDELGHLSMVLKSYDLMSERISEERLAGFAPDILVQVSRMQCGIYDFHKAEEQVEAGRRAAVKVLDSLQTGTSSR